MSFNPFRDLDAEKKVLELARASGIGAHALLNGLVAEWLILAQGSVLIAFCIFCLGAAVWRHVYAYRPPPRPDMPSGFMRR